MFTKQMHHAHNNAMVPYSAQELAPALLQDVESDVLPIYSPPVLIDFPDVQSNDADVFLSGDSEEIAATDFTHVENVALMTVNKSTRTTFGAIVGNTIWNVRRKFQRATGSLGRGLEWAIAALFFAIGLRMPSMPAASAATAAI